MNGFKREKFSYLYIIIMIYNQIMVQANVEFVNDDDINIPFESQNAFLLRQSGTETTFGGSGFSSNIV